MAMAVTTVKDHYNNVTKINEKEFKKWLRALRSGQYNQAIGELQDYAGYCCLGVACKVLIKPKLIEYKSIQNGYTKVETQFMEGAMPNEQKYAPAWLSTLPEDFNQRCKGEKGDSVSLTQLNDTDRYTFEEIADILDAIYIKGVLEAVV
jgi:hypothetical protein